MDTAVHKYSMGVIGNCSDMRTKTISVYPKFVFWPAHSGMPKRWAADIIQGVETIKKEQELRKVNLITTPIESQIIAQYRQASRLRLQNTTWSINGMFPVLLTG